MNNSRIIAVLIILFTVQAAVFAQLPPVFKNNQNLIIRSSELKQVNLSPTRVIWQSDEKSVKNSDKILAATTGQADFLNGTYLQLINESYPVASIILDFGREIQGGIELVTTNNNKNPVGTVRVCFGESVAEAMNGEPGKCGATNDHAMRVFNLQLPWFGRISAGNTGFRFVRIDLLDPNTKIEIKEISAVFRFRDIPYLGSFECNDERLNQIWMTGAYTVHLNMQEFVWDGIKRDRLVWIGDLHPEVMTISSVFGFNDVVPKSLDLVRNTTVLPDYMNGISSYSIWWIIIQHDWYYFNGNLEYLKQQKEYLVGLLKQLSTKIDESGKEKLDGSRFLDWPSNANPEAIHAGLQSLLVMAFQAGKELSAILGDKETVSLCEITIQKLKKHVPGFAESKQAASLLALSGLVSADKANNEILKKDGVHGMSTFYGYYMLKARATAGDYQGAIDNIREYWGGMLDMGATTFWEDFDIDWTKNAARIDEIVPVGKIDIHSAYGNYCYIGFRHSLCHGWASGPTSWLSQYVLGVNVLEPGCKKIKIEPHLGDLQWVKGSFPTPLGVLQIEHKKDAKGKVMTTYIAPKGVTVIK
ncbi:MAG: alpha-L-rhamnosidase C-terminal domain-containing protein [Bacteroidales bacterium]